MISAVSRCSVVSAARTSRRPRRRLELPESTGGVRSFTLALAARPLRRTVAAPPARISSQILDPNESVGAGSSSRSTVLLRFECCPPPVPLQCIHRRASKRLGFGCAPTPFVGEVLNEGGMSPCARATAAHDRVTLRRKYRSCGLARSIATSRFGGGGNHAHVDPDRTGRAERYRLSAARGHLACVF